jgi:NADPH:quinone reductase-like Zn-dependent oxidoreductase
VSILPVDIDRMMAEQPDEFRRLLDLVWNLMNDGTLPPLPTRAFPAEETQAALHLMAQSQYIGKVAVTFDGPIPVRRG